MKKSTSVLFDYFHLSDFWYYKLDYSGFGSYIATQVAWSEYFSDQKLYVNFPLLRDPQYLQEDLVILPSLSGSSFLEVKNLASTKFNIHHGLIVLQKTATGVEGFGFSTNVANNALHALLLNELPLLRLFIKKFKEDNLSLIFQVEENQIDFSKLIGPSFFKPTEQEKLSVSSKRAFMQKIGIKTGDFLSQREAEVLKCLLKDNSASQTGKLLHLSKRTIEHHVERIKGKLFCDSKAELIQKARELESYGILR